jgi:hypothetical protein
MILDKTGDYRKKFSEDFAAKFGVRFPWQSIVPKYSPVPIGKRPGETPFCELFFETVESVRITYLLARQAHEEWKICHASWQRRDWQD